MFRLFLSQARNTIQIKVFGKFLRLNYVPGVGILYEFLSNNIGLPSQSNRQNQY